MINGVSTNTFRFQVQFRKNLDEQHNVLLRLATARRINAAKDDPAGLIAATMLEAESVAAEAEQRSIQRAYANANIAEGHTAQLSDMTAELRAKTVEAANTGAMSDAEIAANQMEIDSLTSSIQRFAQDAAASLDGINLPNNGSEQAAEQLRNAANAVATLASGGSNSLGSGNFEAAQAAIQEATTAFAEVRGAIGAYQKHTLEPQDRALGIKRENLLAAHSQIVDADFAVETSNLARAQVLTASSAHVLKIANHSAGLILNLLS